MKISMPALVAIVCVYTILFLGIGSVVAKKVHQEALTKRAESSIGLNLPVSIAIPKLGLHKDVQPGVYDVTAKTWSITSDHPHFATISTTPNSYEGNTVIYAHNTRSLFGRIGTLSADDTVSVTTRGGTTYTYVYDLAREVEPSDVNVFNNGGAPRLTLITCTGDNNSRRLLVVFRLVSKI